MAGAERRRSTVWGKIRAVRCEDVKEWCVRRLPILEWVPIYDWKENLVPDAVSGMLLAIQQVTQGTVKLLRLISWNPILLDLSGFLLYPPPVHIILKHWLRQLIFLPIKSRFDLNKNTRKILNSPVYTCADGNTRCYLNRFLWTKTSSTSHPFDNFSDLIQEIRKH